MIYDGLIIHAWIYQESAMSEEYTLASHFEGKEPVVTAIYAHLLDSLRQFGEIQESPKKTLEMGVKF